VSGSGVRHACMHACVYNTHLMSPCSWLRMPRVSSSTELLRVVGQVGCQLGVSGGGGACVCLHGCMHACAVAADLAPHLRTLSRCHRPQASRPPLLPRSPTHPRTHLYTQGMPSFSCTMPPSFLSSTASSSSTQFFFRNFFRAASRMVSRRRRWWCDHAGRSAGAGRQARPACDPNTHACSACCPPWPWPPPAPPRCSQTWRTP